MNLIDFLLNNFISSKTAEIIIETKHIQFGMQTEETTPTHMRTNSSAANKAKARGLGPITIKHKPEHDSKMFVTDNGVVIEHDFQSKGIYLNNSKANISTSDIGSRIELNNQSSISHDMSIQSEGGYVKQDISKMSLLQEDTRKSFSEMSISEGPKSFYKNTLTKTILAEDPDGFLIPASKNIKPISNKINTNSITPIPQVKQSTNMVPENQVLIKNPSTNTNGYSSNQEQQVDPNLLAGIIKKEETKEQDDNEIKLEDLKKIGILGAGSQGHVEKMVHVPSGRLIALKVVKLNTDESFLKALKIELNTLQHCDSEYIVRCYGAYLNQDTISIALEFMDKGTLQDILKICGTIDETILGMITYQVLKGFEYLHKTMKVIHRDIKPSNLLVNSEGHVKIADFGVSGKIDSTFEYKQTWVGTLPYMSPERCKGEAYNFDTDIWSLGLTILECALGRYPFVEPGSDQTKMTFWDLLECISTRPVPKLPEGYSSDMADFISICLRKQPGTRSNATQLLQHSFVKKYAKVSRKAFIGWLSDL